MLLPPFTSQEMNVFRLREGRYILYLDILGFSDLVQTKSPDEVYESIDSMIKEFYSWEKMNRDFDILYFSDTIVFYQKPLGWGSWAFSDIYIFSVVIWSSLAAIGVPTRGAISFGQFEVKSDSGGRHNIYFGNALIEAHREESAKYSNKWIGILVCTSAWQAVEYADKGRIEQMVRNRGALLVEKILWLNPFYYTGSNYSGAFFDHKCGEITCALRDWNAPSFRNEILALDFIRTQKSVSTLADYVREKYIVTWNAYTKMLDPEVLAWCRNIVEVMKPPLGNGISG